MVSRAYNLEHFIRILETWGIQDVLLPFLLIFVIVFGLMSKTKILGDAKKRLNAVVAFVMATLVVVLHVMDRYPTNMDPVVIIGEAMPGVSAFIVAMIAVIMIIGLFGGQTQKSYPMYATGAVIILCGVIFVLFAVPNLTPLMFVIAIVMLMAAMFSGGESDYTKGGVTFIAFVVIFIAFGYPMGWFDSMPNWMIDESFYGWIAIAVILIALLGLVVGGEKEKK